MKQHQSIHDLLMDESFFRYVIKKEPSEIEQWEGYLRAYPEQLELVQRAKDELLSIQVALTEIDAEENYKKLLPHLNPKIVRINSPKRWKYYIAACITVFFIASLAIWSIRFRTNADQPITYMTKPSEKKNFKLPDGTLVKLNADSKIEVAKGFGKTNRAITLVGEVYMEVAKNKALPFTISTEALDVRVLGTTLNIRAYANEEETAASLLEGSAEVTLKNKDISPIRLKPMDKVVASAEGQQLTSAPDTPTAIQPNNYKLESVTQYDAEKRLAETSWTEQKLVFVNEPLQGITKTLERWYNVKFEFQNEEIKDRKYTAAFDESEELQNVLESLRASIPFRYQKAGPRTISIHN